MMLAMWPTLPGFSIEAIDYQDEGFVIIARANTDPAICPKCQTPSASQHSWYERTPNDLPSIGERVRLCLQVRRFFCTNPACLRKVFCERLPQLVKAYARRTERLNTSLTILAFALGSREGTKVVSKIGMPANRDTLIRLIRKYPTLEVEPPTVIGVDDWAFRKGHNYGTIICDLEAGRAIDLLPDRAAETLKNWLQQYPSVEIVTRDRSKAYASGVSAGAPQALQIADRWHLMHNLVERLEEVTAYNAGKLQRTDPTTTCDKSPLPERNKLDARPQAEVVESYARTKRTTSGKRQESKSKQAARLQRYNRVIALREKGVHIRDIAAKTGLGVRTINRWLDSDGFPERKKRARQSSLLDPHYAYLDRRWEDGCHNAAQLYREIQQQAFIGCYGLVAEYAACRRRNLPIHKKKNWQPIGQAHSAKSLFYTPRQAAFFFVRHADKLSSCEQEDLNRIIASCPMLAQTYELASSFAKLLRQRDASALFPWLAQVQASGITALKKFARGLVRDQSEVLAALTYQWSNGPVEGHVNRLKMIKRLMYGRANFDLLRYRALYWLE
jgi:transposase